MPLKTSKTITIWVLFCMGVILSVYYIYHFQQARYGFSAQPSFCSLSAFVDCDSLQYTNNAALLGIPIGAWSLFYFLLFIQLFILFQRQPTLWVFRFLKSWAIVGIGAALVQALSALLIYKKLCITCGIGWVVLIALGLFILRIAKRSDEERTPPLTTADLSKHGLISLVLLALSVVLIPNMMMASSAKKTIEYSNKVLQEKLSSQPTRIPEGILNLNHPEGDYYKGNPQAKVQLIIFHDYECPICGKQSEVFHRLMARFKNDVLFVLKNFPLDHHCNPTVQYPMHQNACYWANVGRCLGQKDRDLYWKFYEVFNRKHPQKDFTEIAGDFSNINAQQISQCVNNSTEISRIDADISHGLALYVSGTPTFFVNGYRFEGYTPYYLLEKLIEKLLAKLPE